MLDASLHIQPRAIGRAAVSSKQRGTASVLDDLHQSGCLRVLFPRAGDALDGVLINTAGGVTGGDRLAINATVGQNSALTLTTQAAERAYRAQAGQTGQITTELTVQNGGALHWLPQEMILFDGCALDRRLTVDLAPSATVLLAETVVFGRTAMQETLSDIRFHDRIAVRRGGTPIYLDGISLTGNATAQLARAAVGQGAGAMASVIFAAPQAEGLLDQVRKRLPPTGGASLLAPDLLVARLVAPDSFILRQSLIPILERLTDTPLPRTWRL